MLSFAANSLQLGKSELKMTSRCHISTRLVLLLIACSSETKWSCWLPGGGCGWKKVVEMWASSNVLVLLLLYSLTATSSSTLMDNAMNAALACKWDLAGHLLWVMVPAFWLVLHGLSCIICQGVFCRNQMVWTLKWTIRVSIVQKHFGTVSSFSSLSKNMLHGFIFGTENYSRTREFILGTKKETAQNLDKK